MPFRIGVIGAGWYGCHLATSLASLGFEVQVFERNARPLNDASGNNQFRLHVGFHYARHYATRMQSRDGFMRFIERYPSLSAEVAENLYAVPRGQSLIDYQTYKLIMVSSGIDFVDLPGGHSAVSDVEGVMRTHERDLLINKARDYFSRRLGGSLRLNHPVVNVVQDDQCIKINGESFDYAIDATWGHHQKLPLDVYYEPTMLLYYECMNPHPAVTLVDGPLCSIYPTEDRSIFTLSSVAHTPIGRVKNSEGAKEIRDSVNRELVASKRLAMENQVSRNVSGFRDNFRFVGVQLAIKTKPVGASDDRSCYVYRDRRLFSVMSGKIDTIFFATERILSLLEADNLSQQTWEASIRNDIVVHTP